MSIDRSGLLQRARAVAQFVVADLDSPQLADEDEHHLVKVLRARPKEEVALTDGAGAWRMAAWTGDQLDLSSEIQSETAPDVAITVGFSVLKGDKNEWLVQKLTEIGVDVIVPVVSQNTVVRWDSAKGTRNVERLERIAYEAAMQSRRVWLPVVESLTPITRVLERGMAVAHPGGEAVALARPSVVVGPEGGLSKEELDTSSGLVDLGPTILRAETAATTLGVLLCALRANSSDSGVSVLEEEEPARVRASNGSTSHQGAEA